MVIKIIQIFTLVIVLIVLAAACLLPRWVKTQAEKNLGYYFKGAAISTGTVGLDESFSLVVSNVLIRAKEYSIDIKRVSLDRQLHVTLAEPKMIMTAPFVLSSPPVVDGSKPSPTKFKLSDIRLRDLEFEYKQKDIHIHVRGSLDLNAQTLKLKNLRLTSAGFKKGDMSLEKIVLEIPVDNQGVFTIEKIKYNKLIISSLKSQVKLDIPSRQFNLYGLSASLIGGNLGGAIEVLFKEGLEYRGELDLTALSLSTFTKDFELPIE